MKSLVIALLLSTPLAALRAADTHVDAFRSLVRVETWSELWPDAEGKVSPREVEGEIWNEAIRTSLAQHNAVHLPMRARPYYLDGPIVLKSGQKLTADPTAEIRLKPGTSTCMVRNEHVVGFAEQPVPVDTNPDTDIVIEGGIWTTLATTRSERNGNLRGASAKQNPVLGTHGVILLHNVRRVTVRNITVRQSKAFAVHLGNAHEFTVDGVTLDRHGRDGVHVNGPASHGLVRHVRGDSADDTVALNAWEWKNYAPSYGPIHHVLIEDVTGAPDEKRGADAIRMLPGVKRFSDGTTLDCPIYDITLRRITDIREFKLYAQPNLELGRDVDFSMAIGTLSNIRFEGLTFTRPGTIEIHANADNLTIHDVKFNFPLSPSYRLISIGPKSATYKGGASTEPALWREIFSPDLDCTVQNLKVSRVRDAQNELPIEKVVQVIEQKPNPDYPKTTPRGGVGKGIWVR